MSIELTNLLSACVGRKANIDELRHWIALNVWESSGEDRDLVDQIAVEMAYIDDGSSDEETFLSRMAEVLAPTLLLDTGMPKSPASTVASSSSKTSDVNFLIEDPGEVKNLRVAYSFG